MLETDSEIYPAMLSLDNKNYILLLESGKLKIHGSGLKGKHMPIVCDLFRDVLCHAIFSKTDLINIFKRFRDLSKFSITDFQVRIYPSKVDYKQNTLYRKLLKQLASAGYPVVAGSGMEYVKTTSNYKPVMLFSKQDQIDTAYYKKRLAKIASRILRKPAKALLEWFNEGATTLGDFN